MGVVVWVSLARLAAAIVQAPADAENALTYFAESTPSTLRQDLLALYCS
jgi:hypothetical protein